MLLLTTTESALFACDLNVIVLAAEAPIAGGKITCSLYTPDLILNVTAPAIPRLVMALVAAAIVVKSLGALPTT